tara:strand:- start:336 stop:602 length:267 start_codon:yes stop_codon:yes gene_type:complete
MSIDPNEGTYHREWSEDELRDLIKDVNEELLDNYYWEYVAPLEKQLKELLPKERLELLIKLLPYVLPKVQTVNAKDGEPISSDWMDSW